MPTPSRSGSAGSRAGSGWHWPPGAVLALLLLGGAGGMLIQLAGSGGRDVPGAGSVDVGFAQDMSAHHLQAVQMASWERDHTADPALRQLAFDIESTRTNQVGRMQGWLTLWGQPLHPGGGTHMAWMAGPGGHPGHSADAAGAMPAGGMDRMPGMATGDELAHLRALSGSALDVDFLQLMLRHHEGGRWMLAYAAEHAAEPTVRNLAATMLTSQTDESQYLRALLAQRGAQPLPAG